MKNINYELINKVLDAIIPLIPEHFGKIYGPYSFSSSTAEEEFDDCPFITSIQDVLFKVDPFAFVKSGASKIVIISPKFGGAILKISFNGFFELIDEYNYEDTSPDNTIWTPFHQVADKKNNNISDYCLAEFHKYNNLAEQQLECFVAETVLYLTVSNINVFLQEYVIPLKDHKSEPHPSKEARQLAASICKPVTTDWIAMCIECYGQKKVEKFFDYCDRIDPDLISDTHYGNYGYREDGSPCILDFSGFWD